MFSALALFGTLFHPAWDESWVRLVINAGLLAIVLASIAVARPFSLQYANERVPEHLSKSPGFAVSVVDLAKLFLAAIPHTADRVAGIAALVFASKFTSWYPGHVQSSLRQNTSAGACPRFNDKGGDDNGRD